MLFLCRERSTEIEDDFFAVVSIDIIIVTILFLKRLEIIPPLFTDPVLAREYIRAGICSSEESILDEFRS